MGSEVVGDFGNGFEMVSLSVLKDAEVGAGRAEN